MMPTFFTPPRNSFHRSARQRKANAGGSSWRATLLAACLAALAVCGAAAQEVVNVYTDRQEVFLQPLFAAFEQTSGIKPKVLYAKKGLLTRLQAEGESSPADIIIAADAGRMQEFTRAALLSPLAGEGLGGALAPGFSTPHWLAITRRARVFFVRKGSNAAAQFKEYTDLAAPHARGKVCLRSGAHPYNIALFADMLTRLGAEAGRAWLLQLRDNLARRPQGKDRTQINDVAAGVCEVGVANSYYYFQLLNTAKGRQRLQEVAALFPPAPHINVTAAGLTRRAPNRRNALALLRFLTGRQAQQIFAEVNFEFPARNDIPLPPLLAPFGDAIAAGRLPQGGRPARLQASRLVEEIGFNR